MYLEYLGSPYPSTVASCFYVSSSRGDQTWTWCSVKLPSVRSSVPSTARVLISQKGPPEERLNGRRLFFDPSDSHPLTGLVPWTSATNAENCDWNYDACLSCWPIATPIHLSKHSRWSFFVALSHEEGVERYFSPTILGECVNRDTVMEICLELQSSFCELRHTLNLVGFFLFLAGCIRCPGVKEGIPLHRKGWYGLYYPIVWVSVPFLSLEMCGPTRYIRYRMTRLF